MLSAWSATPLKGRAGQAFLFLLYLVLTVGLATVVAFTFDASGGGFLLVLITTGLVLFLPFWKLYKRTLTELTDE
ncbi:hypothetical protein SAMN05421858_4722 [Haladaptatus litoreus]|uniref:Uncharacterized protein n=1 Tax=Haladaptatus litoreus TaxID=553468 RepID=A0A1N7F1N2_9EURY|nr:hypothetical protein SAMN05421858_4722 [Haladaptatus litoreus]